VIPRDVIQHPSNDACYRCGYDLRGIENTQPCPECGLLAERSRHVTDELHDTRPIWLRKIALGGMLIVLAIPSGLVAPPVVYFFVPQTAVGSTIFYWLLDSSVFLVASIVLFAGVTLLTAPENYPPADTADAWLRRLLRALSAVPIAVALLIGAAVSFQLPVARGFVYTLLLIIGALAAIPLPFLIFLRLRGLAKRARSAHLAEHCLIVGIGTSAFLIYLVVFWIIMQNASEWFGDNWISRSVASLMLALILFTAGSLFVLWSAYLTIRFAWAFWKAARELRWKWRAADRSEVATD
jgi:hypothetical protein